MPTPIDNASFAAQAAAWRGVGALRVVPMEQWDELLARMGADDVYLSSGYHHASAQLEPGSSPVLLHLAAPGMGDVALPLLIRPLPSPHVGFDATTAYGYGGPVASGPAPPLVEFGAALDEWARANDLVSTFLRFHPLIDTHAAAPPSASVIELGPTAVWSIGSGRDLEESMHKHHRRVVRKARREGAEVVIATAAPEQGPLDLGEFRELYELTMRRQQAADYYFFPDSYWTALARDPGGTMVLTTAHIDREMVASLLCLARGEALHYHLGASSDRARGIGASNLAFLSAAQWGQGQGLRNFHLGGGVGSGVDSLFEFKHRYDPDTEPRLFRIGTIVHDDERYSQLSGEAPSSGFFPAYRAP